MPHIATTTQTRYVGPPKRPVKRVSDARLETPDVYGFMVVNASSLGDAIAIAQEANHMALGGTTIARPAVPVPR
jgi:hypothetical protein